MSRQPFIYGVIDSEIIKKYANKNTLSYFIMKTDCYKEGVACAKAYCNQIGCPVLVVTDNHMTTDFVFPDVRPPLLGRPYITQYYNCYTLVRDFYTENFGIQLNDYPLECLCQVELQDLFPPHMDSEGFSPVALGNLQRGDLVLMRFHSGKVNHVAVCESDRVLLQHFSRCHSGYGELSRYSRFIDSAYRHHTLNVVDE
ncbi:C40 family peptidase [Serratia quinivorans]|uniref:C40 family peptidase n=1 Tax=Serratia quinivorans TaxID=137545 RepID=UPI0021BD4D0D|nr:C40 family peptidase [Serratia quinivorans]